MARNPQEVTDAELAVLEVLWERGASSRRQLAEALYPRGGPAGYTTVQKLLERLEAKGFVTRDRGAGAHVFRAAVGRDEIIRRRLRAVADSLCDGSLTPLLTHLVRGERLSDRERDELRALIEELDQSP